jgi:hypothetical protein
MKDRQMVSLTLARGELNRVLVESGTTLLVVSGSLLVRGPIRWLAESVVAPEARLGAEQTLVFGEGGWIDLVARQDLALLLVQPGATGIWQGLRRLGRRGLAVLPRACPN